MKLFPLTTLAAAVPLLAAAALIYRRAGKIPLEIVSTTASGSVSAPVAEVRAATSQDGPALAVTKSRNRPSPELNVPTGDRFESAPASLSDDSPHLHSIDIPTSFSSAPRATPPIASVAALPPETQSGHRVEGAWKSSAPARVPESPRHRSVAAALAGENLSDRTPHERLAVEKLAVWEDAAATEPAADAAGNATVSDEFLRITLGQDRFNQLSFLASRTDAGRAAGND